MTGKIEFEVIVKGDGIVVTLPDTHFEMEFQKSDEVGLVQLTGAIRNDQDAPIAVKEFCMKAWQEASSKACELGWIGKYGTHRIKNPKPLEDGVWVTDGHHGYEITETQYERSVPPIDMLPWGLSTPTGT